ncbi:metallophosphatase family protein [Caldibacillus lycopersici]|uniref:Metallophosphatase family protein n=1 Tax=Perspicuibacillus lycopersici TaxID=1325689 RepID=A0AAE3IW33_9BACI|nr:metallophosphoesterase family protein [Perspicuibacillus lycopersici]MCU9614466.1 metallophosphatase family protein [Perspicuibacillus lycopersici]
MKIAFISDIHGNAVALEAVLADIKTQEVDKIFVLGDICFRGPEPKRSLQLIQQLHTDVVKGNADEWVVRGIQKGEVPDQAFAMMAKEREWIKAKLSEEDIAYLDSLPQDVTFSVNDSISIHAFHATPNSLFDAVLPDAADDTLKEMFMQNSDASVYVYGHIHKSYVRYIEGIIVINIGSVGLPFDGVAMASYGLLEIHEQKVQVAIRRVGYDREKVISLYQTSDYPNGEMMSKIIKTGSQ